MMNSLKSFKMIIMILIALIMLSSTLLGDIFMKQKSHTDGFQMMGQSQPAQDEIQEIWVTQDKIRSDSEKQSVILRLDQNKLYMLNHEEKTYAELPLDFGNMMDSKMKEAMEGEDMDPEQKEAMMQMMQGMGQIKVTITPTSETKKIGNWNCKKYTQTMETMMGPTTSEIWATEDLKMDQDLYSKFMAAMSGQGMFGNMMADMAEEMKKIKGVPVLTVSTVNMMGASIKSTQELIEFKEGTAPAGIFELPKAYKKTDEMNFRQ
jgi:hypothetical protein